MSKLLTLDDWASDKVRRKRLEEILADPVFAEACETLKASYLPTAPALVTGDGAMVGMIPPAADLNNLLALRHTHRAGFFGFQNALGNLTREAVLKKRQAAPWGEILPEDADPKRVPVRKKK